MRPAEGARTKAGRVVASGAALVLLARGATMGQEPALEHALPRPEVALQPLAQHVRTIATALAYLGQPLPPAELGQIDDAL